MMHIKLYGHFLLQRIYKIERIKEVLEVNKKKITFPKGFFTQPRPHITNKKALKDVVPFIWSDNVLKGKSKVKIVSINKKQRTSQT